MKLSQSIELVWLNESHQPEIHPTSGFRAVRLESGRQRRLNSAVAHLCDVIDTVIDWEEIGKRWFFERFEKSGHFQAASFQVAFAGPFYASNDGFWKLLHFFIICLATILLPFFFFACVMKSLRRIYDRKWSTKRWMKQTQLQLIEAQSGENESDLDLDLWPLASRVRNTFWCQCGECVARDRRQDYVCCFHSMSSVLRKFAQRRKTTRRSAAVAVDLPLFAPTQLRVLDGIEKPFRHDQAPSM